MKHVKTVICILLIFLFGQNNYSQSNQTDSTVTDFDGNVYPAVKIGNQIWMAENLRTTHQNDGISIPRIKNNTDWSNLITPGYCFYNNDSAAYSETYGTLYNWYTVEINNLCPIDWHVPSDEEWTTLTEYLQAMGHSGKGSSALKSKSGWNSGGNGADNYGFTALPSGSRSRDGRFFNIGRIGIWWCSTELTAEDAYIRMMFYDDVHTDNGFKKDGYAVRCIKDDVDVGLGNENTSEIPNIFTLYPNFPNPFNPSTTIKYSLNTSSHVLLKIYNLAGQELEILMNGFQTSGEHELTWQPKGLPSGIYFSRLHAGGFTDVRKMIFME